MFPFFTIDIGNTLTKVFKWNSPTQFEKFEEKNLDEKSLKLVCSVKKEPHNFTNAIDSKDFFIDNSFLSMPVHYEQSLGMDRLVCSFYAFENTKKTSVVIDAGTFTKIELISAQGYRGGYILPGIDYLKKSYAHGSQLQKFCVDFDLGQDLPCTSQQAINRGFTQSVLEPIKRILESNKYSDLYLTGGNSHCIYEYLKLEACQGASIHLIPDLIHRSLALIATKVLK